MHRGQPGVSRGGQVCRLGHAGGCLPTAPHVHCDSTRVYLWHLVNEPGLGTASKGFNSNTPPLSNTEINGAEEGLEKIEKAHMPLESYLSNCSVLELSLAFSLFMWCSSSMLSCGLNSFRGCLKGPCPWTRPCPFQD